MIVAFLLPPFATPSARGLRIKNPKFGRSENCSSLRLGPRIHAIVQVMKGRTAGGLGCGRDRVDGGGWFLLRLAERLLEPQSLGSAACGAGAKREEPPWGKIRVTPVQLHSSLQSSGLERVSHQQPLSSLRTAFSNVRKISYVTSSHQTAIDASG